MEIPFDFMQIQSGLAGSSYKDSKEIVYELVYNADGVVSSFFSTSFRDILNYGEVGYEEESGITPLSVFENGEITNVKLSTEIVIRRKKKPFRKTV